MKQIKRIISIALILALLCAMPITLRARSAEVHYPTIVIAGGWHRLIYDEPGREGQTAFDSDGIYNLLEPTLDRILASVQALDFDGIIDALRDATWEILGPARMDENGESVAKISVGRGHYNDSNINKDEISFNLDWRLEPIAKAESLHEFITYVGERRGIEKFHLRAPSGGGPVLLTYLKEYGYNRVASAMFDLSMHNGSTLFGEVAKRKFVFDTEAVGKASMSSLGNIELPPLQPTLRILYESGLLDIVEKLIALASKENIARVYEEIIIPLLFMMPTFWSYVPAKDYAEAKTALLRGDPKYAGLAAKLDRYHNDIQQHADQIILDAADHVKIGIRAGYGMPLAPVVKGAAVQADLLVDTAYASLGATCAPLDTPFAPWYRQKVEDGHNHISPDRLIDASTCLLPEQTWFAFNSPHGAYGNYSGWYTWFKETENPTVFSNESYPQFAEMLSHSVFVPLVVDSAESALSYLLKTIGLFLLKIWRWLLLLPLDLAVKIVK